MKKRKIKFLTTAACLALIGSASAAWVYCGTATASANINVKVAPYASKGTITITGSEKINVLLDKDSVSFVRDSEEDTLTAKHNVPSDALTDKTVQKYFKVTIMPALYKYITFTDDVFAIECGLYNSENKYIETKSPLDNSITYENCLYKWEDDTDIFSILPGLKWKSDQCPDTDEEYITLINTMIGSDTINDTNWSSKKNTSWTVPSDSEYYIQLNFYSKIID